MLHAVVEVMAGEGLLGSHSRARTWSRNRTVKNSKMKENLDDVVVIDVDEDGCDNVIIIDVPEPKSRRRGCERVQVHGVISIDDDDDEDGVDHPGMGVDGGGDLESDTASSKGGHASGRIPEPMDLDDDDECQVVREESSSFRFSKCTQTNSEKNSCSNRYGLDIDFGADSSDSDWSDCEVVEGSFGKVHREWEKAYLKKKFNIMKRKYGTEDQATSSSTVNGSHPDVDVGKRTEQHTEAASCSNMSNANHGKKSFSAFIPTNGVSTDSLDPGMKDPYEEPDIKKKMHTSQAEADFRSQGETHQQDPPLRNSKCPSYKLRNDVGCSSCCEEKGSEGSSFWSHQFQGDKRCHNEREDQSDPVENFINRQHYGSRKARFEDEESNFCKNQNLGDTNVNNERVHVEKDEEPATASCSTSTGKPGPGFMEEEESVSTEPVVSDCQHDSTPVECTSGVVFEESFLCRPHWSSMTEIHKEKVDGRPEEKSEAVGASLSNNECAKIQSEQGSLCSVKVEKQIMNSTSSGQLDSRQDKLDTQTVTATPVSQVDIINEREKLKQTVEYKQAMEEEWASRKRQLQIQV